MSFNTLRPSYGFCCYISKRMKFTHYGKQCLRLFIYSGRNTSKLIWKRLILLILITECLDHEFLSNIVELKMTMLKYNFLENKINQ